MNSIIILTGLVLLSACGSEQQSPAAEQKSGLQKTLQPQLDALHNAQGVEGVLENQKQLRDERMAEQGI